MKIIFNDSPLKFQGFHITLMVDIIHQYTSHLIRLGSIR
jgi:hypothetical protein